jgi:hypothetical protein
MNTRRTLLLVSLAILAACDNNPPATPDSGSGDSGMMTGTDTGPRDSGPPPVPVCMTPRAMTLTLGMQSIMGNTTGRGNDQNFGAGCGSGMGTRAPQEALALTLPGTGMVGVSFTMVNAGTPATFDTLVVVRPDGCTSTVGAECFDDADAAAMEFRSAGQFVGMGGSTVFVIVSGYDMDAFGAWQMDLNVAPASAPTLTGGTVLRVDGARFDFTLMGTDAEGDVDAIRVSFLDAMGMPVAVDGETVFEFGLREPVDGMMTFTARSRVGDIMMFPAVAAAPQARVALLDVFGLASADMTLPIMDVMESGRGEVCDATHVCADAFECTAMMCAIPAATATACAAATPIALTPGTSATTVSVMGTIPMGTGVLAGSCGDTTGGEVIYSLVVPPGTWDLVLSTDNAMTAADTDTVVYVQATCGDPETEMMRCNDDIDFAGMNYHSRVEARDVAPGTYSIAVESYGVADMPLPFQLDATLRPVLGMGMACDPMGIMNRCAAGPCPAATPVCP